MSEKHPIMDEIVTSINYHPYLDETLRSKTYPHLESEYVYLTQQFSI